MASFKILLMGASYGSLLASKLLFGGHSIHLVCLPAEADLINAEGFKVRLPVRGRARHGSRREDGEGSRLIERKPDIAAVSLAELTECGERHHAADLDANSPDRAMGQLTRYMGWVR